MTVTIPHRDRVALRAYFIWDNEGRPHGRHADHWFAAEAVEAGAAEAAATRPVEPVVSAKPAATKKAAATKKTGSAKAAVPKASAEAVVAAAALAVPRAAGKAVRRTS